MWIEFISPLEQDLMKETPAHKYLGFFNVSVFSLAVIFVLYWGWLQRDEYWISAEKGLGYAFGIIGASMMALLLLYPLRKNIKLFRNWLPVRYWFKAHMLLGILGPTFIIFHSNFNLGSTNSNVALFCMVLVVLSGLIGRFIYRRIHNGLYGKELDFNGLHQEYLQIKTQQQFPLELGIELDKFEHLISEEKATLRNSFRSVLNARNLSKTLQKKLKKANKENSELPYHQLKVLLKKETSLLSKMVGLSFYRRLFSLWHVAHLPFFIMMVITAIIHIIIVHMY